MAPRQGYDSVLLNTLLIAALQVILSKHLHTEGDNNWHSMLTAHERAVTTILHCGSIHKIEWVSAIGCGELLGLHFIS